MRHLLPVTLAFGLAACASHSSRPFLPEPDWQAGARSATVEAIDTPSDPLVEPACAVAFDRARAAGMPIVLVSYRTHRTRHHMFAVAEAGHALQTGKWVELWPADCSSGQLARVVPVPGAPQS